MKRINCILLILLFQVISTINIYSLELYVSEPRRDFGRQKASIEDMAIVVKPHGNFVEAGIFLTFSPIGSKYNKESDTLEVVLDFELTNDAFINDMWLFVNDSVYIKAKLVDKWTAGFIYEGIVQRRADPSILYKVENGKYKIKIFPLLGNSTRTVKINMFLPVTWDNGFITTNLPTNFINASSKKVQKIRIFAYPDTVFSQPFFCDNNNKFFSGHNNPRFPNSVYSEISDTSKASKLCFKCNTKNGYFVNLSEDQNEKFYQMNLKFDMNELIAKPKKIAFLLDYDENKSNYTKEDVFKKLKSAIKKYMHPSDSFNIFIAGENVIKAGINWLPVDSIIIDNVFNNIHSTDLKSKTYLQNLLFYSADWINRNSDSAMILLVACTDQNGKQDTANSLGSAVLSMLKPGITMNICSFVQKNWVTNVISGMAVTGNDYLYGSMVRMTRGIFNKIQDSNNDLDLLLKNTLNSLLGGFENVNTFITFEDGFTYDQEDNKANSVTNENINIIQYGKYQGDLPMRISVTGYYRKEPFHKMLKFDYTNIGSIYDNRSLWASRSIKKMEDERNPNYMMLYDIINKSLDYRILSVYTSFLATEDDEKDTISEDSDVPVELTYFGGYARQSGIDLNWETASEVNNYGFYIERKIKNSNRNWDVIGFVNGVGNSKVSQYYQYFDSEVELNHTYQYRLRQVDNDGIMNSGSLSNVIEINYFKEFELVLEQNSPNPFGQSTNIRFKIPTSAETKLEIFDLYGNLINTLIDNHLQAGNYDISWNANDKFLNSVSDGVYICKLTSGAETRIIKMMLSKK